MYASLILGLVLVDDSSYRGRKAPGNRHSSDTGVPKSREVKIDFAGLCTICPSQAPQPIQLSARASMAIFILVHGGAHGGWCWNRLVPELTSRGHRAIAPDLPGMGDDRTPIGNVTLAGWGEFIARLARETEEPAVLVGHSRGGPVIGEAAERAPEAVLGLIYLTAVLIPAGMTTMGALHAETATLTEKVTMTADGLAFILDRDVAKRCFYHRAAPEDAEAAANRLCPEPIAPNQEPMSVTEARWGRVPRAFIECTDDKTLPLALQRRLQAALPCNPVVTLDSDHSPFLCMPGVLAGHLVAIADDFARRRAS
jgi:pimeloyl-ACP methyl ester carboxylesterase